MNYFQQIKDKIERNQALVGIIGLGYVGLPLAHALCKGACRSLGFDIDQSKIESLARGRNYLVHLGDGMTRELLESRQLQRHRRLHPPGQVRRGHCVRAHAPWDTTKNRTFPMSSRPGPRSASACASGQPPVSLESTTYPRTTAATSSSPEILNNAPAASKGLKSGQDFFVIFSPEREDPGRKSHSTSTIPKLVGGLDDQATQLGVQLYEKGVTNVVAVSTAEVAESAKLLENIFRAVNIALVNEMKTVLQDMDIDIWEVVKAASTKPFGFMPFIPGQAWAGTASRSTRTT